MVKTCKNQQITMTTVTTVSTIKQFNNETNRQFSAPDKPMTTTSLPSYKASRFF